MASIKKYLWLAHLLVIAACAYFAAQTVALYLGRWLEPTTELIPKGMASAEKAPVAIVAAAETYEPIHERNFFNSAEEAPSDVQVPTEDPDDAPVDLNAEAVPTSLSIKVLGTLVFDDGNDERSSATVQGGDSRDAEVYYVNGDKTFAEGVQLVRVKKNRIEFTHKGRLEYAPLQGVAEDITIFARAEQVHGTAGLTKGDDKTAKDEVVEGAPSEGKESLVIGQADIDQALGNLDKLYTEIRIVPNFNAGKPAGMKVLSVKPESLFSKLGLKRGDVLARINGMELDIKRGMELFSQLQKEKNIQIEIVRNGKNQTLQYEIQ